MQGCSSASSEPREEGTITIQYNYQGEVIYVQFDDGKRLAKPIGNLAKDPLPGVLIGTFDLGEILVFKQPDGKLMRACHIPKICVYW